MSGGAPDGNVEIHVTAVDLGTGETSEAVISDDYVLICAGSCYRAEVQADINGTHVITVKGVKRKTPGGRTNVTPLRCVTVHNGLRDHHPAPCAPPVIRAALSRPVVLGTADGLTTGIGLALGMTIAGFGHLAVWAAGFSGGLSAFPGMASGQFQSDPAAGKAAAVLCGLATAAGSVVVVLPFRFARGDLALAAACLIAAVLCAVVAWLRPDGGWKAVALSYGITVAAVAVVVAGNLIPGL